MKIRITQLNDTAATIREAIQEAMNTGTGDVVLDRVTAATLQNRIQSIANEMEEEDGKDQDIQIDPGQVFESPCPHHYPKELDAAFALSTQAVAAIKECMIEMIRERGRCA